MDLLIGTAIIDTGTANPLGVCFSQLLYRAGRNRRERIAIEQGGSHAFGISS